MSTSYQLLLTNFPHTLWTTTPSYNLSLLCTDHPYGTSLPTDQVLVQLEASPPEEVTWENVGELANKVNFEEGRDVDTLT